VYRWRIDTTTSGDDSSQLKSPSYGISVAAGFQRLLLIVFNVEHGGYECRLLTCVDQ
jgi:hypothetical protein